MCQLEMVAKAEPAQSPQFVIGVVLCILGIGAAGASVGIPADTTVLRILGIVVFIGLLVPLAAIFYFSKDFKGCQQIFVHHIAVVEPKKRKTFTINHEAGKKLGIGLATNTDGQVGVTRINDDAMNTARSTP